MRRSLRHSRATLTRMISWHEGFAEDYDEWSARMTADIPFYVGLAREANGPLFELAIGNGIVTS